MLPTSDHKVLGLNSAGAGIQLMTICQPALVVQLDVRLTGDQEVGGLTPTSWQHSLVKIDHEIFPMVSMVILSIPLIQDGQLLVSGEIMWLNA